MDDASRCFSGAFHDSEVVIALVGAVGTERELVSRMLRERLEMFRYQAKEIRISSAIIDTVYNCVPSTESDEYDRISALMDHGNKAREDSRDNAILAEGATAIIAADRERNSSNNTKVPVRRAYLISSLKHPDEVVRLRAIYGPAFFLLGVYSDRESRVRYLVEQKRVSRDKAEALVNRDEDEHVGHGQKTTDTFHLSDFFIDASQHQDDVRRRVWRILDLMFGSPHLTPTFHEYAMFLAFAASLRSADMSRQVGAVIARNNEILATGANDCPKYGGGLYWPVEDADSQAGIYDVKDGRDHTRGIDSNAYQKNQIAQSIADSLAKATGTPPEELRRIISKSPLSDITEYGRSVHAEMEALLSCARNGISCTGATLYSTTYPCHNCAKHIVAAGIHEVRYIEPYPKSKTMVLHDDAATMGDQFEAKKVRFLPFVGVGPQRFLDLFSMRLGAGRPLSRKDSDGKAVQWTENDARLRTQLLPVSYLELEKVSAMKFRSWAEEESHAEEPGSLG